MNCVWIGDARCEQMRYWRDQQKKLEEEQKAQNQENSTVDETINTEMSFQQNHTYITENSATIKWFNESALQQMFVAGSSNTEIIITIGLYDCLHSCRLKHLLNEDANTTTTATAEEYCTAINELVEKYKTIKFYFCSVNPVTKEFPDTCASSGVFTVNEINEQIRLFNSIIKDNCDATYIDTADYLSKTSFNTLDGCLYTKECCLAIQDFIESKLTGWAGTAVGNFIPRLTAPDMSSAEESKFWTTTSKGGFNKCMVINSTTGSVLPNCVGYAWGRFMEILGSTPALSTSDAEYWYGNNDGYERGTEPKLGAVACWRKGILGNDPAIEGGDGGHVAIVEQIEYNDDGSVKSIKTSESGYQSSMFWTESRTKGSGNWGESSPYVFQGFIYCPSVTGAVVNDFVSKADVTMENKYLSESEMQLNARYIWQYLGSKGWTLNAVAGMIGNMQSESTLSPNRYEGMKGLSGPGTNPTIEQIGNYFERYKANNSYYKTADSTGSYGRYPGCGLTQWTFSYQGGNEGRINWRHNKHIKWCDDRNLDFRDMDSALEHLIWEKDNGVQFGKTTAYPITFQEFSVSTQPARWLAEAFLDNYENPANPDFQLRGDRGEAWFNYLLQYAPGWGAAFEVKSFKIDTIGIDTAQASFLVSLGEKGSYKLLDAEGNTVDTGELDVKPEVPEEPTTSNPVEDDEETDNKDAKQETAKLVVIPFSDLVPNSTYTLELSVYGKQATETQEDSDEEAKSKDIFEESLEFTTKQAFPEPVVNAFLEVTDLSIWNLPDSSFKLTITEPMDWGYWKTNSKSVNKNAYGYSLNFIINGAPVRQTPITMQTFHELIYIPTANLLFPEKSPAVGDTIQFSIQTYVTDNSGEKVYSDVAPVMSPPVCLLNKPYRIFLNRDDVNTD